jgi:hypothetical protein
MRTKSYRPPRRIWSAVVACGGPTTTTNPTEGCESSRRGPLGGVEREARTARRDRARTSQRGAAKRKGDDRLAGDDVADVAVATCVLRVGAERVELVQAPVGGPDGAAHVPTVFEREEAPVAAHVAVGTATGAPSAAPGQQGEDDHVQPQHGRQADILHVVVPTADFFSYGHRFRVRPSTQSLVASTAAV